MAALSDFEFQYAETVNEVVQEFTAWTDCTNDNSTLINGLPKVQAGDRRVEIGNFRIREKATGKIWPNTVTFYKTPGPDYYFGTKTGKTLQDFYPLIGVSFDIDSLPPIPSEIIDTDLFAVNRDGTHYKVSGAEIKTFVGSTGTPQDPAPEAPELVINDTLGVDTATTTLLPAFLNIQDYEWEFIPT